MERSLTPPAANTAISYRGFKIDGKIQLDTYFIGNDGALYVAWVIGPGTWNRPVRISKPNIAPPGANIAVGGRGVIALDLYPGETGGTDFLPYTSQVNLFFIGNDGALYVAWAIGLGAWNEPTPITQPNIAPPGAILATAYQTSRQLDVFFIGNNGALHVVWANTSGFGIDGWNGPVGITPTNIAPPGGGVATAYQTSQQLDVFFIGNNGALHVSWVIGGGNWLRPVGITPENIAPPGGRLATAYQTSRQLDVFFIGNNGALHVSWVIGGDKWQGPVSITPENIAPPGGGVVTAHQTTQQLVVLFVGNNSILHVSWVIGGDKWQGPVGISQQNIAPPGAPLTSAYQTDTQLDIFVTGHERWVFWTIGTGNWQGPFGLPN
ncbi:beta propeller lectin [Bacillus paranthracis]|uniref:hypothetical protein n=1 Tax=Bacillus paranthracis TaxID=2026186 RepID=UPI00298D187B|nr:hypothetical protein [Bacillus paranthracis]